MCSTHRGPQRLGLGDSGAPTHPFDASVRRRCRKHRSRRSPAALASTTGGTRTYREGEGSEGERVRKGEKDEDTGGVGHVVALLLQPVQQGVLGPKGSD